jgi:hypothetical protein
MVCIDHVAHTGGGPTIARMFFVVLQAVTIIVGQLFARRDGTCGIEPNATTDNPHLTIWGAAVIEKPGQIPRDTAVDIIIVIKGKDVDIVPGEFGLSFSLGESWSEVLNDAFTTSEVDPGKASSAMDRGGLDDDEGMSILARFWHSTALSAS